jgi:hypothetical protein
VILFREVSFLDIEIIIFANKIQPGSDLTQQEEGKVKYWVATEIPKKMSLIWDLTHF